jgi:hypothetical protein
MWLRNAGRRALSARNVVSTLLPQHRCVAEEVVPASLEIMAEELGPAEPWCKQDLLKLPAKNNSAPIAALP